MPVANYEFSFEHLKNELILLGKLSIFLSNVFLLYVGFFYVGFEISKPTSRLIAFNVVRLLGYLEDTVYLDSNTKRQ